MRTTYQHPFYVDGKGWLPAGGLAIGNSIVTRAGPRLFVKSIKWNRRAQDYTVYNFEVEALSGKEADGKNTHSYFVGKVSGGAWVHNGKYPYLPPAKVGERLSDPLQYKELASKGLQPLRDAFDAVMAGRGVPNIGIDGLQKTVRGTDYLNKFGVVSRKWLGATEWFVPGLPDARIVKRSNGYLGFSLDHDYGGLKDFPIQWH